MAIESYRDLRVWQAGRELVALVYRETLAMPDTERYGLTSQMRRAVVSIPSNIAEGWGRHYPAEFKQFLRTANGSLSELETQLILSADLAMLTQERTQPILEKCHGLGRQLLTLERRLKS